MNELIERLEKATGPDRGIDVAIDFLMYPEGKHVAGTIEFTSSTDAALTLRPEGVAEFELSTFGHAWFCRIGEVCALSPTPALAICIAALGTHLATPVKSG